MEDIWPGDNKWVEFGAKSGVHTHKLIVLATRKTMLSRADRADLADRVAFFGLFSAVAVWRWFTAALEARARLFGLHEDRAVDQRSNICLRPEVYALCVEVEQVDW